MSDYIDAFAFPIAISSLETYKIAAQAVAEIYLEHGAKDYFEYVGDDMHRDGTLPFPGLFNIDKNETVVFGWIAYDSKDIRDLVNQKIENDPRLPELLAPIMNPEQPIFEPDRMAFGGFKSLIKCSAKKDG